MSKTLATWFSPSLGVKQRSKGASAVAAAAYRACVKLTDERDGKTHDYTHKTGHVKTFTVGPFDDINELWQAAEKSETRKNSVVARELIVPLPCDWTDKQREDFVREFAEYLRVKYGVALQASLHRPGKDSKNEHVHLLMTTRVVNDDKTFGEKTRSLDLGRDTKDKDGNVIKGELSNLREEICKQLNAHADKYGDNWYVYAGKFNGIEGMEDHVSLKHVPFVSKDKLNEKSNYDVVTKAQEHNARVIEYRKLKHESKNAKEELAQIECDIENDLTREDEQRQKHAVNVPVVAPVVKSEPEPLEKLNIEDDWIRAVKYQSEKRIKQQELIKQREDWETYLKNLDKPQTEKNIFGFETKKSKRAKEEWNTNRSNALNQLQAHTDALSQINEELLNPRLLKHVELFHKVTAHNEHVDAENARIQAATEEAQEQRRLRQLAEAAANVPAVDYWEQLNKVDQATRQRSQSQLNDSGLTM